MMKIKLLIADYHVTEAIHLKIILQKAGYAVCAIARSIPAALNIVRDESPQMVLLDINFKGQGSGIHLAHTLSEKEIAFIYLSANANQLTLNIAKQTGAHGILAKPFRKNDALLMLGVAAYLQKTLKPNQVLPSTSFDPEGPEFANIVGKSKTFLNALEKVKLAGSSDIPVLIYGENGTGKELIARAMHALSARKDAPLIVINCATLSPGLIELEMYGYENNPFTGMPEKRIGKLEQANGGTILLDEIAELPITIQAKFLQVLLNHKIKSIGGKKHVINVRVIATTNHKLEYEIECGRFRMDLYYYLNVAPITLPALRERKEDITLLAKHFVDVFATKANKRIMGLSDEALTALNNHSWPGNIRELKNLMERCVLLTNGNIIDTVFLPPGKDTNN